MTQISEATGGISVNDTITVTLPDGQSESHSVIWTSRRTKDGFFDVLIDGKVVGSGYCMNNQCHIGGAMGDTWWEETFTMGKHHRIFRLGSKTEKNFKVSWSGMMRK